jgi:hypothetical protein
MTKINSLTADQQAQLAVYRDKWLAIGLACEDYTTSEAELTELVAAVYRAGGLEPPARVVVVDSPREAQRQAQAALGKTGWVDTVYGNHDAGWLSFYDYMRNALGLRTETEPLAPLLALSERAHWFVPLSGACFVSRRPTALRRDTQGRLHGDGVPALEYADGYAIWALHGVRFTPDLAAKVVAPAPADVNPADVLALSNVEQRAVAMSRVGLARFFDKLGPKLLDKQEEYHLYEIQLGEQRRVYLRMQNPSVDEVHLEAVHPTCATVTQALNWRNFGEAGVTPRPPVVLT